MEYRNLGASGLQVSAVGLGCNNFGRRCDAAQTKTVVEKAIELGVTFFDTADIYGPRGVSEEYLGAALKEHRRNVVIATKFAGPMGDGPLWGGASRRYIFEAVDASLRRLGADYIDLYQIHFPDVNTPIEETMRALDDVVRAGKARYIGCSNFASWQVVESQWVARGQHLTPFVSAQNQYNLLDRRIERELAPACQKYGLGVLPYFPLANGFLTGKYRPGEPPPEGTRLAAMQGRGAEQTLTDANYELLGKLESFARERAHSMLDLAIGWLASQPFVSSVIAGATKPEQIEQNVAAAAWKLTGEEMADVAKITRSQ
ncbi:MAG: oxidoreductase, aryl-alcohol dehydrogenase like protein [Alphaproteobacteria bacterium]|nr:MAG: oxidoreductase, aryl-alcohol dehydrogenase like protein [Alphaproteobacteria bacterium]